MTDEELIEAAEREAADLALKAVPEADRDGVFGPAPSNHPVRPEPRRD